MGLCASTTRKEEGITDETRKRLVEMEELFNNTPPYKEEPTLKVNAALNPTNKFVMGLRPSGNPVKNPTTTNFGF